MTGVSLYGSLAQVTFAEVAAVAEAIQAKVVISDEQHVRSSRPLPLSFPKKPYNQSIVSLPTNCFDLSWPYQDTEVPLYVRRAELTMETDGALAVISAQHEQQVQSHSESIHAATCTRYEYDKFIHILM